MKYTYVTHQVDNHPHNFSASTDGEAIEHIKKLYGETLTGVIILTTDELDQSGNVRTLWIE